MEISKKQQLIGTVLSVILSSMGMSAAQRRLEITQFMQSNQEVRMLVSELLNKQFLYMDNQTGLIQLSQPVEKILKSYNVI